MIGNEMAREQISDRLRAADADRVGRSVGRKREGQPRIRRRAGFTAFISALIPGLRRTVDTTS